MSFNSRFPNAVVEDEPVYKSESFFGQGFTGSFFTQTADSTEVSDTTEETSIIGSGIGSLSVPADTFKVGNTYLVQLGGTISVPNSDDITIRVKSDSVVLASTGLLSCAVASSQVWQMQILFVIRAIGRAGVGEIHTHFTFSYEEDTAGKFFQKGIIDSNKITFNTTIQNNLDITVEWGQQSENDIIQSSYLVLNKLF